MSQITRCPHCDTTFRVVPDQLRIADGWVRCGQCKEVFDACQSLHDPQAQATAEQAPMPPAGLPVPHPPPAPVRATPPQADVWRSARGTPAGRPMRAAAPALPWFLLAHEAAADVPQERQRATGLLAALDGDAPDRPREMPEHHEPGDPIDAQQDGRDSSQADHEIAQEAAPAPVTAAEAYADTQPTGEFQPAAADPQPTVPDLELDLELPPVPGQPPDAGVPVDFDAEDEADIEASTPAVPELELPGRIDIPPAPDAVEAFAGLEHLAQDAQDQEPGQPLPDTPMASPFLRPARNQVAWPEARAAAPDDRLPADVVATADIAQASAEPPESPEPQFVRLARRSEFWQQPAVRGLLALSSAALALLLVLQLALQQRDALAARQPALRPLLQLLCALPGCTLAPPREPGSVVIDSSSFTRAAAPADGFTLRFALKNNAGHGVAMPLVELTLTDSQDQPVLRRVLQPQAELGAPHELAAGAVWSGAAGMQLAQDAPEIAGYHLLAFYP